MESHRVGFVIKNAFQHHFHFIAVFNRVVISRLRISRYLDGIGVARC